MRATRSGGFRQIPVHEQAAPRNGTRPETAERIEAPLPAAAARKPAFRRDAIGQAAAVLEDPRRAHAMAAAGVAAHYTQGRRATPRIEATLSALARLGHISAERDGYRLRRAA